MNFSLYKIVETEEIIDVYSFVAFFKSRILHFNILAQLKVLNHIV